MHAQAIIMLPLAPRAGTAAGYAVERKWLSW